MPDTPIRPHDQAEQPWQRLVSVEVNSLLNRASQARDFGKPQAAAALEWCAKAIQAKGKPQ